MKKWTKIQTIIIVQARIQAATQAIVQARIQTITQAKIQTRIQARIQAKTQVLIQVQTQVQIATTKSKRGNLTKGIPLFEFAKACVKKVR